MIEINGGVEEPLEVMKPIVEKQKLNHPVLWDMNCRNHRNYGLKNWPVAYLVDTHGKVFWEGNPARVVNRRKAVANFKKLMEEKLREAQTSRESAAQPENGRTAAAARPAPLFSRWTAGWLWGPLILLSFGGILVGARMWVRRAGTTR